jgi:hypothetical protein
MSTLVTTTTPAATSTQTRLLVRRHIVGTVDVVFALLTTTADHKTLSILL